MLNRQISTTDALSHTTRYAYDVDGDQITVTDPLGHTTTSAYDVRNRLVSTTSPSGGGTTTYAYDIANRLLGLTDADGNATTYGYDNANRVTSETDPLGHATTYGYDLVGNLTGQTDRDGRVIQFGHDADDRETTEKWMSGGSSIHTTTYTYDSAGRLTTVNDPDSKYTYTYDNANRLTGVDNLGTPSMPRVTLTYGYDNAGNRTSMDDNQNGLTSYTYDSREELTRITQSGTGVAAKRVDFAYDSAGRRTTLTRYSDLAGMSTVLVTKYAYDSANRLTTLTHQTSGGTVRAQYVYTLDAADRLTGETRSGSVADTLTYTYTNDGQLTGVTHTNGSFSAETFSYDSTGNRNSSGYGTGTGNRMTTDGTYNYTYDDEGNLTAKTSIATGNQTLYKWDYRNRLTEVDSKVGATTTTVAVYTYDALDRRIKKVVGSTTTWTAYDGASAILDFDGSGTLTARYLQGPMIDEILARATSSGVAWYLSDREGTIRDLVDNTGAVIDHVDYSVYGQVIGESAPTVGDRWKYTGRELDSETGLYQYRARYYDATAGRFVGEDPVGLSNGESNLYRYVGNSPSNSVDSFGLQKRPIHLPPGLNPPPGTINPPGSKPPTVFPPRMIPPITPPPGYSGPVRPGLLPNNRNDPSAWIPAGCNLMNSAVFQQAAANLLAQAGRKARLARETGMGVYYNPNTGELYFLGITPGFKGENGFFNFGNPRRSYPGGWVLIGLVHSHPFPPAGLGPPGIQDVMNGQPKWPVPWYIVAGPNPNGPPSIYGVVQGTVIMPGCQQLNPGQYIFGPNGGLVPL